MFKKSYCRAKPSAIEKFEEPKAREIERRPSLANYKRFEARNQPTLTPDRIKEMQGEINKFINGLAEAEYRRLGGGVPIPSIRHSMTARVGACLCAQYLKLQEEQS
jgi:hypothetical protein